MFLSPSGCCMRATWSSDKLKLCVYRVGRGACYTVYGRAHVCGVRQTRWVLSVWVALTLLFIRDDDLGDIAVSRCLDWRRCILDVDDLIPDITHCWHDPPEWNDYCSRYWIVWCWSDANQPTISLAHSLADSANVKEISGYSGLANEGRGALWAGRQGMVAAIDDDFSRDVMWIQRVYNWSRGSLQCIVVCFFICVVLICHFKYTIYSKN